MLSGGKALKAIRQCERIACFVGRFAVTTVVGQVSVAAVVDSAPLIGADVEQGGLGFGMFP